MKRPEKPRFRVQLAEDYIKGDKVLYLCAAYKPWMHSRIQDVCMDCKGLYRCEWTYNLPNSKGGDNQ